MATQNFRGSSTLFPSLTRTVCACVSLCDKCHPSEVTFINLHRTTYQSVSNLELIQGYLVRLCLRMIKIPNSTKLYCKDQTDYDVMVKEGS